MQISNVHAGQQIQSAQRTQTQDKGIEGSKAEEAKESSAEKATEALKNAVAKNTGKGTKFDISA